MKDQIKLLKMKHDIVRLDYPAGTSFSWTNGLYIVVMRNEADNEYRLTKLGENGEPSEPKGSTRVGLNNPYIIKTGLTLEWSFQPKEVMEQVMIPRWQLMIIKDALRLTCNVYGCRDGKTSYDRDVKQAEQFAGNALIGKSDKEVKRIS